MKKTEEKTKEKEGIQIPALHKARGMSSMGLNLQNSTVSKQIWMENILRLADVSAEINQQSVSSAFLFRTSSEPAISMQQSLLHRTTSSLLVGFRNTFYSFQRKLPVGYYQLKKKINIYASSSVGKLFFLSGVLRFN